MIYVTRRDYKSTRLFPNIDDLYRDGSSSTGGKRRIDRIFWAKIGFRGRRGWGLDSQSALFRLVFLHRRAFKSEAGGLYATADFWWQKTRRQWLRLPPQHSAWRYLATELNASNHDESPIAEDLATVFAREVLLDTHLAFFNAHILQRDWTRAALHIAVAREWFDAADIEDSERKELIGLAELMREFETNPNRVSWDLLISQSASLCEGCPESKRLTDAAKLIHRSAIHSAVARREMWEATRIALQHAKISSNDVDEWTFAMAVQLLAIKRTLKEDTREATDITKELVTVRRFDTCVLDRIVQLVVDEVHACYNNKIQTPSSIDDYVDDMLFNLVAEESDLQHLSETDRNTSEQLVTELSRYVELIDHILNVQPSCYSAHQAIAALHLNIALIEKTLLKYSQALLSVEKALTHRRGWKVAESLRSDLESQLSEIESQFGQVRRFLSEDSLNGLGKTVLSQIGEGTKPRDKFRTSAICSRVKHYAKDSELRWLWLRAHKPISNEELEEQIQRISHSEKSETSDAASTFSGWHDLAYEYDATREQAIGSHLGTLSAIENGTVPQRCNQPSSTLDNISFLAVNTNRQLFERDWIPWDFWLFGKRDLATKFFLLLGIVALLTTGVFEFYNRRALNVRNAAFTSIQSAADKLDSDAAIKAIRKFRSVDPLSHDEYREGALLHIQHQAPDWERQKQMNASYAEFATAVRKGELEDIERIGTAFLKQAVGSNDGRVQQVTNLVTDAQEIPRRKTREEAIGKLNEAETRDDVLGTINAARTFLTNLTVERPDDRSDSVREAYDRAIVRWASQYSSAIDDEIVMQLDGYRRTTEEK